MKEIRIEEFTPIFGKVSLNITGISFDLFTKLNEIGEFQRQKNINHLGLISFSFNTLNHTRYDYFIIQSVLSELIENNFRGTTSAQGSLNLNGVSYRGNELLKVWFMLSNFGHCKNTVGDEKSLMIFASKRRGFFSKLTKKIDDSDLFNWAKKVVEKFDYVKFHHIISIYRIYKIFKRNIAKQNEFINIYKALLLPQDRISVVSDKLKLDQLKTMYNNIRTLSIIALDTTNSHIPINIDILSTILSFDFNLDKFQGRKLSQLFNPLINLLYEKLYLSQEAQTIQRSYEVRALINIQNCNYKDIINIAIENGLATTEGCHLRHFVRKKYVLAQGQKLKDHFNIMQQIKKNTQILEASIDFNLLTKETVIDIYINKNVFTDNDLPILLNESIRSANLIDTKQLINDISIHYPIINNLNKGFESEGIEGEQKQKIIKPIINYLENDLSNKNYQLNILFFKSLLWSVLKYFIKPQYYFDLDTLDPDKSIGVIYPDGKNYISCMMNPKNRTDS